MAEKKILFVTLSNIGDAILTLPALDYLKECLAGARVTVLCGPRSACLFEGNPSIDSFIVYDKHAPLAEKVALFGRLAAMGFYAVADMRNSFFGAFLPAQRRTSPLLSIPAAVAHMRQRHLYKAKSLFGKGALPSAGTGVSSLPVLEKDELFCRRVLDEAGISATDTLIVVSAGGRSHLKRWPADNYIRLCNELLKDERTRIVLVGDRQDEPVVGRIQEGLARPVVNLCARTTPGQLAVLLKKARLLVTNDSAVLHLAGYLDVPVVAIFGPTSETKYGPWSSDSLVVKRDIACRPCQKAQCRFSTIACMQLVRPNDVLLAVQGVLGRQPPASNKSGPRRILLVRTDRVGDVVLSTPAIASLRRAYPHAYVAMVTSPAARPAVENNPFLDEAIAFDKKGPHKGLLGMWRFAWFLRKKKFDVAIVLHPTRRAHLFVWLAGIPRRIGYRRKMGFLLTDRLIHDKQLGEKHEMEYVLDMLRQLGIEPSKARPVIDFGPQASAWVSGLLEREGISQQESLLAMHPAASCPSKMWPAERFAEVADTLAQKHGFTVVIVAGPADSAVADAVVGRMRSKALNLAGKTSLMQLAALLARCRLFISNDSGPVHIASAVGTPVISIFGRNQKGLSPTRWGPVGPHDRFLHKEVGCAVCLAHRCAKGFACLKAIGTDEVIESAEEVLRKTSPVK